MCSTPLYFVEKRKKNKLKEYPHEVRFEGCTYENFPLILGLILETSMEKTFFSGFSNGTDLKTDLRYKTRKILNPQ